jgi:nucleoside-diphosphate-sugar epimerase
MGMEILITGAGGFIGQALAKELLLDTQVSSITLTDVMQPSAPSTTSTAKITTLASDLTSLATCQELCSTTPFTHVYLLHGIMSGAAEANLELGLKVNVDSMRYMMDTLRTTRPGIRVIFPSSLAVFGPALKDKVTEATMPLPQSSYGAQKQIGETLLNDYSRRGLLDGRIVRLPTIIVRPGKPSGAASSFCSGIIREPLNGEESILPVPQALKLWVCSTRTVIKNLVIARDVPTEAFSSVAGGSRIVNLPGITVTVKEMLDALLDVGGQKARNLIKETPDSAVEQIVGSWPAEFDITRAVHLGFQGDGDLKRTLKEYLEDYA